MFTWLHTFWAFIRPYLVSRCVRTNEYLTIHLQMMIFQKLFQQEQTIKKNNYKELHTFWAFIRPYLVSRCVRTNEYLTFYLLCIYVFIYLLSYLFIYLFILFIYLLTNGHYIFRFLGLL